MPFPSAAPRPIPPPYPAGWPAGALASAATRRGLPQLEGPQALHKLQATDWLLGSGLLLRALMRELGLDASALDAASSLHLDKYNSDQPRVPAGDGIESGRWSGTGSGAAVDHGLHPFIRFAANITTPTGIILNAKAPKDIVKREMTPKQIDDAVKSITRTDAIDKDTEGPATRYVQPGYERVGRDR